MEHRMVILRCLLVGCDFPFHHLCFQRLKKDVFMCIWDMFISILVYVPRFLLAVVRACGASETSESAILDF